MFMVFILIVGAGWGAGLGLFVWVVNETSRDVAQELAEFRPKVGSKVYSADGQLLGEFALQERQLVRLSDIPLILQKAFIATEDQTFYEHRGVNPLATLNGVILHTIQTGRPRGGSTITQQVVRNVETLKIGQERTVARKMREAIAAFQVEREFTKDEILELYLNQIFLGISAYGVEAAAQQYFGKSCRDLTLGQAATIAGLNRAPNPRNPITNPKLALAMRNVVLGQMLEKRFITQAEYEEALQEDLESAVVRPDENTPQLRDYSVKGRFRAPYFVEEVRRTVLDSYEAEQVFEDGLEIYTTLDMRLQEIAERVLLKALDEFDEKQRERLERQEKIDEFMPVSGGLVCIDNRPAYRGFVRAMVGGRDFTREKFNTVTQARRQPGSSIKPFVWAAAIASGFTPSSIVVDAPFQRVAPNGLIWAPKNFDGGYSGPIPIRLALEKSINIISIKLLEQVGTPLVRSYLQRCGIPTDVEGLTIALGSGEVRVLDHAVAYSVFANGGMRYDPVMITEIRDRDGVQRYNYRDYAKAEQAIDPKVAYVALHMLKGVCTPGGDVGHYPTGWRTHVLERPRAGKTGTTNESRDAWFCGFTTAYTTVVWIGYRDNRSLGRGRDYTGGRLAAPVWVDFMMEAHEGVPVTDFETPPDIEFHSVNRLTGVAGGNYKEAFITGTAPPAYWYGDEYAAEPDYTSLDDDTHIPLLEAL